MSSPDVAANVTAWGRRNGVWTDGSSGTAWSRSEIRWGVFGVPESEAGVLGEVAGGLLLQRRDGRRARQWPAEEIWVARKHA